MNASSLWTQYEQEYEQIQEIYAALPKWVSEQHIREELLPTIGLSAIVISIVFMINAAIMKQKYKLKDHYKAAYQLTNLMVNLTLGALGIYYHYKTRVYSDTVADMTDLAIGNYGVFPVACIQFGYNLWAIPIGLLLVKEAPIMIVHHISVIVTSFMTLFLPMGYRYFAPFMFGILETSSVPLAIMNAFKDHATLRDGYPQAFGLIKLAFAVTFLYVRWYLYLPIKYDYLRLYGMGVLCTEGTWFAYTAIVWLASFFLLILQLFWGLKIVSALLGLIFGSNSNGKKKKEMKKTQ